MVSFVTECKHLPVLSPFKAEKKSLLYLLIITHFFSQKQTGNKHVNAPFNRFFLLSVNVTENGLDVAMHKLSHVC